MKRVLLAFLAVFAVAALIVTVARVVDGLRVSRAVEPLARDMHVGKAAAIAMLGYQLAHDDRLPDAAHWEDDIRPYWGESRLNPFTVELSQTPKGSPRRLAMNRRLSAANGRKIADVSNTVLFYSASTRKKNSVANPQSEVLTTTADKPELMYVYLDGHVSYPSLRPRILRR